MTQWKEEQTMSTLVVKVCEMCGQQFPSKDSWLVVDNLDIRRGSTAESLLHVDDQMDFCSPGCMLRYLSRSVEHAVVHHEHREVQPTGNERQAA